MNCENCSWSRDICDSTLPCGSKENCPKEDADENHIVKYQPLYYLGLGFGFKTYCFNIYEKNGERWVHSNCGVHRKESEVLANKGVLFISKDAINKHLANSWMAKLL